MLKLPHLARIALGLFFVTFGLNGFFGFLPPLDLPPAADELLGALATSGYFLVFLKLTETTCGLLLLSGRYVPLALTMLAPVVLNILLFHLFLAPTGIVPGAFAAVVGGYLAWAYRGHFRGVLRAQAQPTPLPMGAEIDPSRAHADGPSVAQRDTRRRVASQPVAGATERRRPRSRRPDRRDAPERPRRSAG